MLKISTFYITKEHNKLLKNIYSILKNFILGSENSNYKTFSSLKLSGQEFSPKIGFTQEFIASYVGHSIDKKQYHMF